MQLLQYAAILLERFKKKVPWGFGESFLNDIDPGLSSMVQTLGPAAEVKEVKKMGSRMDHVPRMIGEWHGAPCRIC